MFGDFLALVMDQVVNQAAKIHYMSGGKWKVPMVIRATMGATRRSAAQHSQSLHAWPSHIPGLKVVVALDAVRRQGAPQDRHPRRQPGRLLRGQDQLHEGEGAGAGGGLHDSVRRGRHQARRARHHARRDEQHGAGGARRRDDARGDRHQRRGRRSADDVAARREDAHRVGARRRRGRIVIDEGYVPLRRDGRDRVGHCRGRVLRPRRPGAADGRACTCRFRSRRRSRMRPCRPSAMCSRWRGRCAIR